MRIIFWELRKIYKPLILLFVAVFAGMFLYFYVFLNMAGMKAPDVYDQYALHIALHERFGASLDKTEREAAESLVASYKNPSLKLYDKLHTSTNIAVHMKDFTVNVFAPAPEMTDREIARCAEILGSEELNGTLPNAVVPGGEIIYFSAGIVLSLCTLLAPCITFDRMKKMRSLQYASKSGRKTIKKQFAAIMLAAALTATAEISAFAAALFMNPARLFLDAPLNSFDVFKSTSYWFSGSFGAYLLTLGGMMYLLAFACAGILFVLSAKSKNYISLLLKVIPCTAFLVVAASFTFTQTFAFRNIGSVNLYKLIPIPYIEVYFLLLLLTCVIGGAFVMIKRQKSKDIYS